MFFRHAQAARGTLCAQEAPEGTCTGKRSEIRARRTVLRRALRASVSLAMQCGGGYNTIYKDWPAARVPAARLKERITHG